jgi:transcriptional regulator with XRE-family HTH domain
MPLSDEQKAEIGRLAKDGKSGKLNDLAEQWGVPFREVVRAYADYQRETTGAKPPTPQRPQELTDDQKRSIRRLAEAGNTAKVFTLAEEWGMESRMISQYYNDCRAELRRVVASELKPEVQIVPPVSAAAAAVADVKANPGDIAVLPRNWPLIQARLTSVYAVRDIATAAGLAQTEYNRIEEGRLLPTPDQAAKICALLKIDMDKTFVLAGQDAFGTRGQIRGLSVLGILRAKSRLSMKDLAAAVLEATGARISTAMIGQIERGQLKQPPAPDYQKMIEALAVYFRVTTDMISAQVPPAWIQTVVFNTAALHAAMKQSYLSLPTTATVETRLLEATGGGDQA